jgi:hypothetical protein
MTRMRIRGATILFAACVTGAAGTVRGAALHREEVIDVQRGTRSQLENLEGRLNTMAERLEKISADDAAKTRKVKDALRDRDVVRDMDRVIDLLKGGNYTTAVENQERIVTNLREIIRSLEGRKLEANDWQAQLDRVKAAAAAIRDLLGDQRALRAESEKDASSQDEARSIAELARQLSDLAANQERLGKELPSGPLPAEARIEELARRVGALAKRQEEVLGETQKAPGPEEREETPGKGAKAGPDESLVGLAPSQAELESASRALERELRDAASAVSGGERAAEGAHEAMSQASRHMEHATQALGRGQKKEATSGQEDALAALRRAEQSLGALGTAMRGRDRFDRARDAQREIARETEKAREAAERLRRKLGEKEGGEERLAAAEKALSEAQGSMNRAQESFAQRRTDGTAQAAQAAKELAEAKNALDEEGLARLRRHDLEKLAGRQDELKKRAEELAQNLKRGEEGGVRRAGSRVDRAGDQMGRAAEKLKEGQAREGADAQDRAAEELAQAEQDLAREGSELERLKQEQEITTLVELLVKVKDGQRAIEKEITACEAERRPDGTLPRSKLRVLQDVQKEERALLKDAATVKELLEKEEAYVFAFVVDDIVGDMEQLREAIAKSDTGAYTQLLARDVVEKIERLLTALREELAQRRREQRTPEGEEQNAQARLIPPVAEGLMLQRMQRSLHEETQALERAKQANKNELNPAMERQLTRLALRQGALAALTRKVARDFFGILPGEEGDDKNEEKKP